MTTKFSIKFLAAAIFCLALGIGQVSAQSTVTGAIRGKVSDPQGAVVPNATVTVTNTGTNKTQTQTATDDGTFRITNLEPGTFTVEVTSGSFAPFRQENVVVEVGQVTALEIPLSVQGTTETVQVTAEAPVINTNSQDFSNNINQTSINELPINGRRASNFVLLTPGVAPDGNFGLISFRGISGLLNNSTVDGGDNNQAFFSEERGRTRINYSISQDAVREFQVNTSNYSAEFGRAAGGVINTVTKSGTNKFHGSAFYYIRDNQVGARNAFSFQNVLTPSGTTQIVGLKPIDRRQQFGGSIGGPIIKDRLFFFFSYDQQKRNFPGVSAPGSVTFLNPVTVSTPANCNAPGLSTGQILGCRNITQAQAGNGLNFLRSLTGEVPRKGDQTLFLPKIDWVINNKNTFSAVYNRLRWNSPAGVQTQPVVTRGSASFGNDLVNLDSLNLRLTSTLTASTINEARFQYSRDFERQIAQPSAPGEATTGPNGFSPQISIASSFTIGKPNFLNRGAYPDEKRRQYADTVTNTRGRHTIKFGGDINYVSDVLDNLFQEGGAYSYSTLADYLTDLANPSQKRYNSFQQGFGPTAFKLSTRDYNFFVQDDFRIVPRLTLNLGLRYEFEELPKPQIPNSLEPRTANFPSDKNNFGPRIGFAYDLTGRGNTSIRGGYGIYYGRIINSTISNAITNTGAAGGQLQVFFRPGDAGSPTFPNVLQPPTTVSGGGGNIIVFSDNMQNPLINQADLVFERIIAKNTVVSISGLLSVGRNLPTFVDTNLPPVPTGTTTYTANGGPFDGQVFTIPRYVGSRPNPNFGRITEIRSNINSEYYAMVLQANRRLTKGLQFQASYTLSKSRDNGQISQTFTTGNVPLNPNNLSLESGPSNFDIPQRFVASAVYSPATLFGVGRSSNFGRAIFGGFTISPIVTIQSGRPYSANIAGNAPSNNNIGRTVTSGIFGAGGANRLPIAERNSFRYPKIVNVDLRISRRFRFTETMNLELLAEGFNIFNRVNVTDIDDLAYFISGTSNTQTTPTANLNFNSTFGVPQAAGNSIFRERQIQFAARFQF